MKRPLSVSVADKASPSGHALLLPAELRELLSSPDTYCRSVSIFFLHPVQTLLINHGTHATTFLYGINGRHHQVIRSLFPTMYPFCRILQHLGLQAAMTN